MKDVKRVVRFISGLMVILYIALSIGTCGKLDTDQISFEEAITRSVGLLIILGIGLLGLLITNREDEDDFY